MYPSQPKPTFCKPENNLNFLNKQNLVTSSSKINILPPKMHRVSSYTSNLFFEEPLHTSSSRQGKIYRNFSKNKDSAQVLGSSVNSSFNLNSSLSKYNSNQDFSTHRYSCNTDLDKISDQFNINAPNLSLYQGKTSDFSLQSRVSSLEYKMKKNQQNIKFYCQEIQHFKHQITSSNLLDSINTNILTISTRQGLKQNSIIQSQLSNKQNQNKNHTTCQSVQGSLKDSRQIQKRLKQIDSIKRQIKKIITKEDIIKGDMKMFQISIKEVLTGFKEYISQSIQELSKRQEKNKKKIFQKVMEDLDKTVKQSMSAQFQNLKQKIQSLKADQKQVKNQSLLIKKSSERFLKDPLLIRVKQQVYGLVKKSINNSQTQSYEEMIKKSIYQSMDAANFYYPYKQKHQFYETKVNLQQAETTYYIDQEGYLLDSQGYYLLESQQKIKLSYLQIQRLRSSNLLQGATLNKQPAFLLSSIQLTTPFTFGF